MKKSKLLMLLSSAVMLFAAVGVTSCVDDNDDLGMPYLEVSPTTLKFDANGTAVGASEFVVKSNRPWTLDIPAEAQWVRPSVTSGEGDGTVSFNLFASSIAQSAELTFSLKNSAGFAYMTQKVTIVQGNVIPTETIFNETFGTAAVASPWPTVDTYKDWGTTGEGIADVTFSGTNTSIRNSGKSSSGAYDGASGPNVLFFGAAPATFTIQNITLKADQTNLRLTFGGQFYDGSKNDFPKENMIVSLSADGTNFVPIEYSVNDGDQKEPYWVLASKDFTLQNAVSKLFIRFTTENVSSAYRLDDVRLTTGNGGEVIDLGKVVLGVTTKQPENVTATEATLAASLSSTEGVTAAGFQYTPNAASIDWTAVAKTPADAVAATFTKAVSGLTTGTTYAVRAYATTAEGDTYGNVVTFTPKGGPSGDEIITDFIQESTYPAGFPASSSDKLVDAQSFVFDGATYTLAGSSDGGYYRGKEYKGERFYLMIGKKGAYIELPAMADKALTSVTCFVPGAASSNVMVGVSTADGVDVDGGAAIKWEYQDGGSSTNLVDRTYVYNLSGTQANTKYRLYITAAEGKSYNAQIYTLTLKYGQGGGEEKPSITPATAKMEFDAAADATGKTQIYDLKNATGLTLFADVADKTNFSAEVENGNTVRVKTLKANDGAARTTTVNVYLAENASGEKKATATINVTQKGQSSGAVAITIPEINALIKPATTKAVLDAENDRVFEAIVMNDVAGGNYSFNNLILATENSTAAGNGVTLYGSQVEPSTLGLNKGDKVRVTLYKELAQVMNYNGMYEVTGDKDATWCKVEKISSGVNIPVATVTPPQLADYQGMAVTVNNATVAAPGVWAVADNISSHTFSASGTEFAVFCKKGATAFLDKPYRAGTGNITGLAAVNSNKGQLVPRDMADVAAFNPTAPTITSLEPDALNWGSAETNAQTISVKGSDIDGKLSCTLSGGADSKFTVSVSGTTVTVTPKGTNETAADFTETLTVTAAGGNSLTASLKQAKKGSGGDKTLEINFSAQGWANQTAVETFEAAPLTLKFASGGNQNPPKYYTSGTALRMYSKNTMTITGATITKIEFTFVDRDELTVTTGVLEGTVWTGSSDNLVFTVDTSNTKSQARIQKMVVTYTE
ncbi:DUF5689 domain-containing protein [Alistipes sp.]|uniref:DUF5689 domain-containing protein n=1 Tax=Alistipes sp. TaxID=1872444 RepID=UPI003AF136DE